VALVLGLGAFKLATVDAEEHFVTFSQLPPGEIGPSVRDSDLWTVAAYDVEDVDSQQFRKRLVLAKASTNDTRYLDHSSLITRLTIW
jgi:hypothetical protein